MGAWALWARATLNMGGHHAASGSCIGPTENEIFSVSLLGQTYPFSVLRHQNSRSARLSNLGCGLVLGHQVSSLSLRLIQVASLVCTFQTQTEQNYQTCRASTLQMPGVGMLTQVEEMS